MHSSGIPTSMPVNAVKEFHVQQFLFVMTALFSKKSVNSPYSEVPLQSERSDWSSNALSLHQGCPCIEYLYKEKLL